MVTGIEDRFELLERVGEGGMALVYRARQKWPVTRIVALKLVKLGMDTLDLLRRFEIEQQTLAQLNHPNIARIFDAGTTTTGRPYFVMEFVEGRNLLDHAQTHRLGTAQRIELMITICRAVQFAHQRGVIHRDLKPNNLLVQAEADTSVPKVIDFGVARAISTEVARATITGSQSLLGTPAYMSPEQLQDSHAVDTRSDVYSLGVVCCELFWGGLPFELDDSGRPRRSADSAIDRPSRRFGRACPPAASAMLAPGAPRGELDWIVLKCLEHSREDRYQSAAELADDLERYQRGEPTRAAPPHWARQLRWFVRRHKMGVVATAAAAAVVLAALAGTSVGLVRERRIAAELAGQKLESDRQRAEADRRRIEAEESQKTVEAVNLYLTGIFRQANPQFNPNWRKDLTLRDALDGIAEMLASDLKHRKGVRAEVCEAISQAYGALGVAEKGMELARVALEIREATLGPEHPKTNSARYNLGNLLLSLGRLDEAEPLLQQCLEFSRRTYGDDNPTTLTDLHAVGFLRLRQKRYDEAEAILREALERKRRVLGEQKPSTLVTANVLASLFQITDRHAEAEPIARQALEARMALYGRDHPATLYSMVNLSGILASLERHEESLQLTDDGLERSLRLFGSQHHLTRGFARHRGLHLVRQGKRDEAIEWLKSLGYDPSVLENPDAPSTQPGPEAAPVVNG